MMHFSKLVFASSFLTLSAPVYGYIAFGGFNTDDETADFNRVVGDVYSNVNGTNQGDPAILTWSLCPDGTIATTNSGGAGSSFVSETVGTLDAVYGITYAEGSAEHEDLTNRPWFIGIRDGLDLMSMRSGLTYIYEPEDDGALHYLSVLGDGDDDISKGVAGVRGDLRIVGISGVTYGGIAGSTPLSDNHPDLRLNVGDFTAVSSLRFLTTHEAMHTHAFSHSTVDGTASLSSVTGSGGNNRGPQIDDILGLHRKYGDFHEKNGGNDTLATATDLTTLVVNEEVIGTLEPGGTIIIGDDAHDDTPRVEIDEFDFISIDDDADTDFLKFEVDVAGEVTITLDPRGPSYTNVQTGSASETITINSDELADLSFKLYNASGNLLQTVSSTGLGESEVLVTTLAAGEYYAEISGDLVYAGPPTVREMQQSAAQLYSFSVDSAAPFAADVSSALRVAGSASVELLGTSKTNGTLSYNILTQPANGTLSGTAPDLTYVADSGFAGVDSFTYQVEEGSLNSRIATVTLNVVDAVILAGYDFDDGSTTGSVAATVASDDVIASDFTVGEGLISVVDTSTRALQEIEDAEGFPLGTANAFSFGGARDTLGFSRSGNLASAITNGEYLAFTVTPTGSAAMNLLNFSFRSFVDTTAHGADDWALYSSVDDFTTEIIIGATTVEDVWQSHVISLTGDDFQNLIEPVEFRLYISGGSNNGGSISLFDKFEVNGATVVVSEFAPTVNDIAVETTNELSVDITLEGEDRDGDAITYTVSNPANGTLSGTAPNLVYTPLPDFSGVDTFTYSASDGTLESDVATVSIRVVTTNVRPTTSAVNVSTALDTAVDVTLLGSDADGDTLSYTVSNPTNGTLSGTAPNFTYTPNSGFSGEDSFTYSVDDGSLESAESTVTILVGRAIPSPLIHYPMDDAAGTVVTDVAGGDYDGSLAQAGTWVTAGKFDGALNFASNNDDVTVPAAPLATLQNEITIAFWMQNTDPGAGNSASNRALRGFDASGDRVIDIRTPLINSNGRRTIRFELNGTQLDHRDDDYVGYFDRYTHYAFTYNAGSGEMKTYFNGVLIAEGTGTGDLSSIASLSVGNDIEGSMDDFILYSSVLDADEISALYENTPASVEDSVASTVANTPVDLALSAVNTDNDALSYSLLEAPSNGSVTGRFPNLTYTPDSGFDGEDSFTYAVNDGIVNSGSAVVTITVTPALEGYEAFIATYSGIADSSFEGDVDLDGNSNGIEYVFGLNPTESDVVSYLTAEVGDAQQISFNRLAESTGFTTQTFQYSEDLTNWVDVAINNGGALNGIWSVSIGNAVDGFEEVTVEITDPVLDLEELFWRVRVVE